METATKDKILAFLKEQKPYLNKTFDLDKIGLFGSFATENDTPESDIDLIVEFKHGTLNIFEKKQLLRNLIFEKFNRSVDVAREKYLKPYYKQQILKEAIYV
jgi:predicted nucleotidyltransferase